MSIDGGFKDALARAAEPQAVKHVEERENAADNPWYTISYEPILDIANWQDYSADTEKKVVAIFSWMPQTIMSIKHKGNKLKYEIYDNKALANAVERSRQAFEAVRHNLLLEFDLENNVQYLRTLCEALFPILGSVASSKYLHFSNPCLFPMWDRQLRLVRRIRRHHRIVVHRVYEPF